MQLDAILRKVNKIIRANTVDVTCGQYDEDTYKAIHTIDELTEELTELITQSFTQLREDTSKKPRSPDVEESHPEGTPNVRWLKSKNFRMERK